MKFRSLLILLVSLFTGCAAKSGMSFTTSFDEHSPALGSPTAKVTLVEFVDFQCPACRESTSMMRELVAQYPDDLRVVFKHLPLKSHSQAIPAAEASIAAAEQLKFWQMHDLLFAQQDRLGPELYTALATELGLDMNRFQLDMLDMRAHEILRRDKQLARTLGVKGVPSYFVNGEPIIGPRTIENFQQVIDRHLWRSDLKPLP